MKKKGFVNSGESWERLTCTGHGQVTAFIDLHIVVQVNPDSPTVRLVVKGDLLIKKRKHTHTKKQTFIALYFYLY